MTDIVRFAFLGLGSGAIYALIGYGLVLVHRGSRILNFAQGAFALLGAYIFYGLRDTIHWPWPIALAASVGALAAVGACTHLVVMRPLHASSPIVGLVASLGVLVVIQGVVATAWGSDLRLVETPLPNDLVTIVGDVRIGLDRLLLIGVAVLACVLLSLVHRRLRYGLAATAVAESTTIAAIRGVSANRLGAINWAVGAALAALAGILIAPTTGLSMAQLSLLVLPALTAALVGNFQSFWWTLVAALTIGVVQAELARFVSTPGWPTSVPFLLTVVVLVIRGKRLPARNEPPTRIAGLGTGLASRPLVVTAGALALTLIWVVPSTAAVDAITTSAIFGVVCLSLVTVTGFAGQVSLAQMALAGVGGLVAAQLTASYGAPFPLALVAGVLAAVPVGLLVAAPAVRTRGVSLAVATAGLALLVEGFLLSDPSATGGYLGLEIGSPSVFGIDLGALEHPRRYASLAVALFVVVGVVVANLRRSRGGLSLVALRANERAAAGVGVNVLGAKLFAFAVAGGLAGLAGVLTVFRVSTASFSSFDVLSSINGLLFAVIGGIGYVSGSVVGALGSEGGLVNHLLAPLVTSRDVLMIVSGVLLIATLIQAPAGAAALTSVQFRRLRKRLSRGRGSGTATRATDLAHADPTRSLREAMADGHPEPRGKAVLAVTGVRVQFGGVTALQGLSLEVRSGAVTGLIGSNGAGKSTLVEVIAGYLAPTEGDVTLNGRSLSRMSPHGRARAGVVRVAQNLELFDDLTVADNIRVALAPANWATAAVDLVSPRTIELDAFTSALVAEFGLGNELDRYPPELSYGHRRLLGVVRALAARPRVLLLDEPGAGLDDQERRRLAGFVERIASELDIAVLLIEHDVAMVLEVAQRVTVLDAGRVLAEGAPASVRGNDEVIAAFLGHSRTLAGPSAPDVRRRDLPGLLPAPAVIEVRNLSAGYDGQPVVSGLDLEVRPGEIVAMLGRNGAGKTTVLHTLAGALPAVGGQVTWATGRSPSALYRAQRAGVALLTDSRTVTMGLTVRENLRLARVDLGFAVGMFPALGPLLNRRAALLSGGEQQMLAVACAQTDGLQVLLADELSLGLAPAVTDSLFEHLRDVADRGVAVLLVEQHVGRVLEIADRACVLAGGTIQLSGTAGEIANQLDEVTAHYLAPERPLAEGAGPHR